MPFVKLCNASFEEWCRCALLPVWTTLLVFLSHASVKTGNGIVSNRRKQFRKSNLRNPYRTVRQLLPTMCMSMSQCSALPAWWTELLISSVRAALIGQLLFKLEECCFVSQCQTNQSSGTQRSGWGRSQRSGPRQAHCCMTPYSMPYW